MEVHIQSRKLIKPSSPTPHHLRDLKLSCFDQIAPATYGSFVFFYPAAADHGQKGASREDEKVEQLERSLAEALTCFYPLAGRYIEGRNCVDCNDQGAEYLGARADVKLSEVIQEEADAKLLNLLVPFPNELAFTPTILAVQVNRFACGGLAIGLSLSHKLGDGFTTFSFMNGWATSCRSGIDGVECPSFHTAAVLPSRNIKSHGVPVPEDNAKKLITMRFVFGGTAILTLKAKAIAVAADSGTKIQPSRVQVVTALIWKARISVAEAKHRSLRNSLLILPYNFRGKTALPISRNAPGNLVRNIVVRFTAKDRTPELHELVCLLRDAVRSTAEECGRTDRAEDLFLSTMRSSREIHEELMKGNADICLSTSCCGFPYYEADFGWGKPAWISHVHKPVDMVLMMDTSCGGGIEAWVTLEPNDMLQFRRDPDILAYCCKSDEFENSSPKL